MTEEERRSTNVSDIAEPAENTRAEKPTPESDQVTEAIMNRIARIRALSKEPGKARKVIDELDSLLPQLVDSYTRGNEELAELDADLANINQGIWKQDNPSSEQIPEAPTMDELSNWIAQGICPREVLYDTAERVEAIFRSVLISGSQDERVKQYLEDSDLHLSPEVALEDSYLFFHVIAMAHLQWKAMPPEEFKMPPVPIVRAWQNRPVEVEPSLRTSKRIIPARLAQASPAMDSRAGNIFSIAAHSPDGRLVLPGFETEIIGPALPLVLYDLGAGPSSRSQAASLALRMFIEALLAVPQQERGVGRPVVYQVTLREFLNWFWPDRTPSPSEYWPALLKAREALFNLLIPVIDPETGQGMQLQVVNIGAIPRGPNVLDDAVRVVVDLPKGSQNGPQLSDNLRFWGNRSAPAYRALINLAFHWYKPGWSHYPVGKRRDGKGAFWAQSNDPSRYPILSDQQLVELCFPTSRNTSNRRVLRQRSRDTIGRLRDAGELRIVDDHIMPPKP